MAESSTHIQFATDEVRIVVDTVPQHLPCEIVMETAPRPLLLIQVTGLDPWIALRPQRQFELHLVRAGITCDAFIASSSDGVIVLVQREMECGRSPLASIARPSAGRVGRPNAAASGPRKQRTLQLVSQRGDRGGATRSGAGPRNRCASPRRWAGPHGRGSNSKQKVNWLGKEES